jgi:ribosomal protein S8
MASNYHLGDLISRLNVGSRRRLECVKVTYSNLSLGVLEILHINGVIRGFSMDPLGRGLIVVYLKYFMGNPVFRSLTLHSRPGRRVY